MQARLIPNLEAASDLDAVAVLVHQMEEGQAPDSQAEAWTGGLLSDFAARKEFRGKALETTVVHRPAGLDTARLLLVGLGAEEDLNAAAVRRACAVAARALKNKGVRRLAVVPTAGLGADLTAQAIVEGVGLTSWEPDVYKTEDRPDGVIEELLVVAGEGEQGLTRGMAIADGRNFARALGNEPGNILTPTELADRARAMAADAGLECDVIEEEQLEQMGCGALLGVAQGSVEPPVMIVLRYEPENASDPDMHLGLVGKAVTFDTGGISIKPSASMDEMKYDMAGGAAMLGAMKAIAALKPSVAVTAIVPSVENMPGAAAQRPGDVVTSLSGKTIEVLNTDAEGRLILADALTHAQRLGCTHLVDAATLTGSVVVALGHERGGVYTNDEEWQAKLLASSEAAGEKMWAMPMDDEYKEQLKSPIADLPNIGTRWGGSITAAIFLKQFADPTPWIHLDIAGTAWHDSNKPDMPKGPTGVAVATLVDLALSL